jgi:Zn-dependent peptidase ImmA (M78 family)
LPFAEKVYFLTESISRTILGDDLFEEIDSNGIVLGYATIPKNYIALYYKRHSKNPVILLNKHHDACERKLRCAVAEEIAHHLNLYGPTDNEAVNEEFAKKQAVEILIPRDRLIGILNNYSWEIAPSIEVVVMTFNVTRSFAFMAVCYLWSSATKTAIIKTNTAQEYKCMAQTH